MGHIMSVLQCLFQTLFTSINTKQLHMIYFLDMCKVYIISFNFQPKLNMPTNSIKATENQIV
jgi:hypothetical protein